MAMVEVQIEWKSPQRHVKAVMLSEEDARAIECAQRC
jgi:hypothetical protein